MTEKPLDPNTDTSTNVDKIDFESQYKLSRSQRRKLVKKPKYKTKKL